MKYCARNKPILRVRKIMKARGFSFLVEYEISPMVPLSTE